MADSVHRLFQATAAPFISATTVQKGVLIGRELPRDLRAKEFARDIDFDRAQATQTVKRPVEIADEPFVSLGQTIVPYQICWFFGTHAGQYSASGCTGLGSREPSPSDPEAGIRASALWVSRPRATTMCPRGECAEDERNAICRSCSSKETPIDRYENAVKHLQSERHGSSHCAYIRSLYVLAARIWRDRNEEERNAMESAAPAFFLNLGQVLADTLSSRPAA